MAMGFHFKGKTKSKRFVSKNCRISERTPVTSFQWNVGLLYSLNNRIIEKVIRLQDLPQIIGLISLVATACGTFACGSDPSDILKIFKRQ